MMDLSKHYIRINSKYQIFLGRILIVLFITLFQFLGIMCMNNWQIVPECFFLFSNMFLSFSKYEEEIEDNK